MQTLTPSAAGRNEGERRRDVALQLFRNRRALFVRRVQRAYLQHLLGSGPDTCDPVRALVPLPEGIDPRLVGAAVRALAEPGLIRSVGRRRSTRSEAHARQLDVWAITDPAAAMTWLACHPDIPDAPESDDGDALPLWAL
jgi:hypothetical protein